LNPPDDPVFAEPWEAQAFAMAVSLNSRGLFSWTEWAAALADEIAADPHRSYYESWLATLEKLVEAKQVMSDERKRAVIPHRCLGRSSARHPARPADRTQINPAAYLWRP
jgi:nitrile hydratase accessory protein